jgi:hypothetical protein
MEPHVTQVYASRPMLGFNQHYQPNQMRYSRWEEFVHLKHFCVCHMSFSQRCSWGFRCSRTRRRRCYSSKANGHLIMGTPFSRKFGIRLFTSHKNKAPISAFIFPYKSVTSRTRKQCDLYPELSKPLSVRFEVIFVSHMHNGYRTHCPILHPI